MKKCVIVDTAYPINGRNIKFLEVLKDKFPEATFKVITWNRKLEDIQAPQNYFIYQKGSELGNRIKKFFNIFGYKKYIRSILEKEQPDVVIASHWDSLFAIPGKTNKYNSYIIYDNIDVPEGNFLLRLLESIMEKISLPKADLIIHASRFFIELYKKCDKKQIVIENKPIFSRKKRNDIPTIPLKIGYIGNVRYVETLMPLINAVSKDKRVQLDFYGGGPDLERLSIFSCDNITFHGRYNYSDVEKLYLSSDIIWAAYPNKDFNVKYAISNKFHESLCLSTPSIFANKTMLGDFVEENKIGFVVNPYSEKDVVELLDKIVTEPSKILLIRDNMDKYLVKETTWEQDMKKLYGFLP